MILPNKTTTQSSPAGPMESKLPETQLGKESAPEINARRCEVQRLVQQIDAPEVRDIVAFVFQDLLRLLECLQLIEAHLRQVDAADETFALFQLIHDEARLMVDFIRTDGLSCAGMTEEVGDALDGITFAVNHDLQRVFETNSRASASDKSAHLVVGKLYRSHDVLTNCLQQSTIALAVVFDPDVDGPKLFNNSDMRYRQSLQLCQDLTELSALVESAEEAADSASLARLESGIEKFHNESMESLAYSDWPQFESFCERIKLSTPELAGQESVLHQFRCYLETLLGQVRMRAVLANVFPVRFGEDQSNFSDPFADPSPIPSLTDPQDNEEAAWSDLAIAV